MKLYLRGHSDRYAVEQLQMQLFPDEPSEYVEAPFSNENGAVSTLSEGRVFCTATARITRGGKTAFAARRFRKDLCGVRERRRILQQAYFLAAVQLLDAPPPWGALSGVRPTKLSTAFLRDGGSPAACDRMLRERYFVLPERRRLCVDSSLYTLHALEQTQPEDLSVYIGVPFCPTRCAYCSFVSESVEKFGSLLEPYLQALLREVRETGKLLRETSSRVRTLYIGGGTPTTFSAVQLKQLLDAVRESFDLSRCLEITVEGGRPDTLDAEKLRVIRAAGVDRVSINPQTMSDAVLKRIGRRHSAAQTLAAYRDAREAGFPCINTDLIAGLPGDTVEGFSDSLRQLLALEPENITVHTLALKKGADLFSSRADLPDGTAVAKMLADADRLLRGAGYEPYYLYRQKYTSGGFENVGWCKPGTQCLYNIYMMEEVHTVLALGGGGMTKLQFAQNDLTRFHNPKFPQEYIARIDDVLKTKREVVDLLNHS
ncbi:MAG: coproporphyrinogen dehydrogenase HemZ [Oscillospiraceae bacterium]|nr:coproporphyrinogen dehydrogenase HemZ [Oscillospiraceae bacterium]